jgi:glycosyltransferase involved in cell wall biosynthesis
MIVRDAERSLAAALASAKPFVDEIIVVDTGSADETRRVAYEGGARIFDGDWIFWMDADDVLPPESGTALRKAIDEHPEQGAAFWVMVEQPTSRPGVVTSHAHLKLFPRHPELRFRYRVHEQIAKRREGASHGGRADA